MPCSASGHRHVLEEEPRDDPTSSRAQHWWQILSSFPTPKPSLNKVMLFNWLMALPPQLQSLAFLLQNPRTMTSANRSGVVGPWHRVPMNTRPGKLGPCQIQPSPRPEEIPAWAQGKPAREQDVPQINTRPGNSAQQKGRV